jgi:hypothetical protein
MEHEYQPSPAERTNTPQTYTEFARQFKDTHHDIFAIFFEQLLTFMITAVDTRTPNARAQNVQAMNCFNTWHAKQTTFNAGQIHTRVWRLAQTLHDKLYTVYLNDRIVVDRELRKAREQNNEEKIQYYLEEEEDLKYYHEIDLRRTSRNFIQHCWNVIHDPGLVCDSDDDKQALLFLAQITPHAWQPAAWRPQLGNPSEASIACLSRSHRRYVGKLKQDLNTASAQPLDIHKYRAVYQAFKATFGRMLGETRAQCFTGLGFNGTPSWMQQQAAKDVTKAQWVLLFKESNALWHAVVLAFRDVCREVADTGIGLEKIENGLQLLEKPQDKYGNTAPTHHISDLQIWCSWGTARINVARGRWSTYIKKAFAQNTEHFVREYQTLLMHRYKDTKFHLFAFWFYPSDLCQWVRDLQNVATLPETKTEQINTTCHDQKRFTWPACCKKGVNLNDNPITSKAYFTFCEQNKLRPDDRHTRLQFCMRMRAAWLRVVACYPYAKGKEEPSAEDIKKYLEQQHVAEISLLQDGRDWRLEDKKVLLRPQDFSFDDFKGEELRDRRVLVYGAPIVSSYLC